MNILSTFRPHDFPPPAAWLVVAIEIARGWSQGGLHLSKYWTVKKMRCWSNLLCKIYLLTPWNPKSTENHYFQCALCITTILLRSEFQQGTFHAQAPMGTLKLACYSMYSPAHSIQKELQVVLWHVHIFFNLRKVHWACIVLDHRPSAALDGRSEKKCTKQQLKHVIYGVSFFRIRQKLVCHHSRSLKSILSHHDSILKFLTPRHTSVGPADTVIGTASEQYI